MTNFEILAAIRDNCKTIVGLNTCRIGIETPILPDSYPILRIVLSEMRELEEDRPGHTEMGILVYYGESVRPLNEGGLETQHEWLLDMEAQIKSRIVPGQGWRARWVETVWDEDRVPGFKLFASRFEVWG